jgi:hypothetical protein
MPYKITIKLLARNVQRPKMQSSEVSCVIPDIRMNDLKKLWEAERIINELTAIRCHLSVEEQPSDISITPRIEDNEND